MVLASLITPFPWSRYSKKLCSKIENPRCAGSFEEKESIERHMRLAIGEDGSIKDGNFVKLYLLVDIDDGIIVDAKYQVFGQSALIGAAEVTCELLIGKNYDQAKRIGADLIDKQARDKPDQPAFAKETFPHLNLIISAIEDAAEKCEGLPLSASYTAPPTPLDIGEIREGGYPGWDQLEVKQQMALIEEVLNQDIRPYVELDAGGIDLINLIQGREVVIAYKGSCTSCFSATGATLSAVQKILRAKVHPDIFVTPQF